MTQENRENIRHILGMIEAVAALSDNKVQDVLYDAAELLHAVYDSEVKA